MGKTVVELIDYFIMEGNEACFMPNAHGGGRVIGSDYISRK